MAAMVSQENMKNELNSCEALQVIDSVKTEAEIRGKKPKPVRRNPTVGQLIKWLEKCDPEAEVRVYERGSVWDNPVSSVQNEWRGEKGKVYILL